MTDADILRAQIATSTDPDRLEAEAHRVLGALDAITETVARVHGLLTAHRALGHFDAGYLNAMEDVVLTLKDMLATRRAKTLPTKETV